LVAFKLGAQRLDLDWKCVLDTAVPDQEARFFEHMSTFPLQARSLVVLQGVHEKTRIQI